MSKPNLGGISSDHQQQAQWSCLCGAHMGAALFERRSLLQVTCRAKAGLTSEDQHLNKPRKHLQTNPCLEAEVFVPEVSLSKANSCHCNPMASVRQYTDRNM